MNIAINARIAKIAGKNTFETRRKGGNGGNRNCLDLSNETVR
jgi:hypothetical protein